MRTSSPRRSPKPASRLETEPVTEVFGQRHFFVRDPEGTWLDVIQLVAPDPEWLAANMPTA